MGVTERMKNGEKGVKEMTREHFLEVNDTAGPPQPGVETETGSCHRPGTRRNEDDPKHLERKAQGRRKDRAGKAVAFSAVLQGGGATPQASGKISNVELCSRQTLSRAFSDSLKNYLPCVLSRESTGERAPPDRESKGPHTHTTHTQERRPRAG